VEREATALRRQALSGLRGVNSRYLAVKGLRLFDEDFLIRTKEIDLRVQNAASLAIA